MYSKTEKILVSYKMTGLHNLAYKTRHWFYSEKLLNRKAQLDEPYMFFSIFIDKCMWIVDSEKKVVNIFQISVKQCSGLKCIGKDTGTTQTVQAIRSKYASIIIFSLLMTVGSMRDEKKAW